MTDQKFWEEWCRGWQFRSNNRNEMLQRISKTLPYVWDYSNNERDKDGILCWSFFIDEMNGNDLFGNLYETEAGAWCRDQFGPALVHHDLMYTFWLSDANWMIVNNYAMFRHPEDCFAFQLRFR